MILCTHPCTPPHQVYSKAGAGDVFRLQFEMVRKDGVRIWIDASGTRMSANHEEWLWIFADITQLRKSQESSEYLSLHDELTGLPNRRLLNDRLIQAVSQARRTRRPLMPPAALMSSRAICREKWYCWPEPASGPVSGTVAPSTISPLARAVAAANTTNSAFFVM